MKTLDEFGELIVRRARDGALRGHDMLERGELSGPAVQSLQRAVVALTEEERELVRRCVVRALDASLHDLLAAFQEMHDLNQGLEIHLDGENLAELSGMLNGEVVGEEGWIARFSKYPVSQDIG